MNQTANSMMRPALIGGVALGVASGIPIISALNCACCLWVVLGGVLASYFYVQASSVPVGYDAAAKLGLLTGVIGAVVSWLVELPFQLMIGIGSQAYVRRALEQMRRDPDVPPEAIEAIEWFVSSGIAGAGASVVGLVVAIFFFALFAMLGAILGVAIFQKKAPHEPGGPATETAPPPPPAEEGPGAEEPGSRGEEEGPPGSA